MSLVSADLPSDPDALRAFALACQGELAAATAELQAAADSGDVARLFRDHVARCSDMMSPA
jgi:hypothetical protein